jgi:flagellar biosynthesis component FlhA
MTPSTSSILSQMRLADSVARTRAILSRGKKRHTPVKGRVVGRSIRGGNAWASFAQAGSLYSLYTKR